MDLDTIPSQIIRIKKSTTKTLPVAILIIKVSSKSNLIISESE